MGRKAEEIAKMSAIVAPGQKQFTASVWLLSQGSPKKVLLIHHKKLGTWMQPGGHIEPDENPIQGAVREVREETGIDISELLTVGDRVDEYAFLMPSPKFIMEQSIPAHGEQPDHFHIDLEYVVEVPEQVVQHQLAESHDIGWFTFEEMQSLHTFKNTQEIVSRLLAEDTKK